MSNNNPTNCDANAVLDLIRLICSAPKSTGPNPNTAPINVVIAGGFASGKTSFLNSITHASNYLPANIDESLISIPVHISCSCGNTTPTIVGTNIAGNPVQLPLDIIAALSHPQYKSHISSTLHDITVHIPAACDYLDGLSFLSSPFDDDKTISSFAHADFIFYCVSAKNCISASEFNLLAHRTRPDGRRIPYAIVVTYANLCPYDELSNRVNYNLQSLISHFGNDDAPQSILLFALAPDLSTSTCNLFDSQPISSLFTNIHSLSPLATN